MAVHFMGPLFDKTAATLALVILVFACPHPVQADERPNILWLTAEDIGPQLACYGDETAKTPSLDALATNGLVYDVAWSNYPVCAPARTTIITGMYAATLGAGNMRSLVKLPKNIKLFPEYLREAGYYCTNNRKEDYNVTKPRKVWDESSNRAHYKNRADGQPFFAVFNFTGTHESKIRKRPHKSVIDPETVRLCSYWPDTPEVRQDWAQYYDNLQTMDGWIEKKLDELQKSGLADNTVVVFFGDHGSGMPRHKRFAGDSGMRVPFLVHVPENLKKLAPRDYQAGGRSDRLVGFVDLAPTMLSLAGIAPPDHMEGRAFMGVQSTDPPEFLFGYRDRMDERPDTSRSIRDQRYLYVQNYMRHVPAGQYVHYQQQTPTTAIWYKLFTMGKLNEVQSRFWRPHPAEELYDLEADPEENINLAADKKFTDVLAKFRRAHQRQVVSSGDFGLLNEGDLFELSKSGSPRDVIGSDHYPIEQIFMTATRAASFDPDLESLVTSANSSNPTMRYWAALGLHFRGQRMIESYSELIEKLLNDSSPAVAIVAAESLARWGDEASVTKALGVLEHYADFNNSNPFYAIHALNAIDRLNEKAKPILDRLNSLPLDDGLKRGGKYIQRLVPDILSSY